MIERSSTARDLPLPPAGTHGGGAFGGIDAKVVKVSSMHAVLPLPSAGGGAPPAVEAQSGPSSCRRDCVILRAFHSAF